MTTAATLPADVTDVDDQSTITEDAADDTNTGAVPSIDESVPDTVKEPVEVIEASGEFVEGVGEKSETAGAFLEWMSEIAFEIGNLRISLLDVVLAVGVVLLVMTAAWMAIRLSRSLIKRITRFDSTQKLLAEKLSTVAIWALAFLIGIDLLGIDLTALAFFGGAFGLAIGFGLQKTFGNLISGIILLLDKSIKPGDVISVTDQAGNEAIGQIRKIGIRAISVITRDQTEHLIPNENLMINQVVNWSYSSKDVRVKAPIGVSYDSDLELVSRLLYQAVDDVPRVQATPKPRVNLMGFGDSSVDFEVRFWIQDPEEGIANIRSDVYTRIWELFKEHGVEIPFPQRDLNLRTNKQFEKLIEALGNRAENASNS